MIVLKKIGISILLHNEAILPEMASRSFSLTMPWAGLIQQMLQIHSGSSGLWGWSTLTTLAIILCIGICHKVQVVISLALTITSLIRRRVMLLPFGDAALLSLSWFVIIRFGVLGTVRISVLIRAAISVPISLQ